LSSEQVGGFKKESVKAEIEIQNSDMQKMRERKFVLTIVQHEKEMITRREVTHEMRI
jgi:hypothetical protein